MKILLYLRPELKNIKMKNFRLLSVIFVLFSAIQFTSCETEPVDPVLNENINNGGNPGTGTNVFKVDYTGQTHTATQVVATVGNELIQIGAVLGPNGEALSILIEGAAVGTYTSDKLLMAYDPGNTEDTYNNFSDEGTSGTVKITSINMTNHTMSGTFSFKGWYGDAGANLPAIEFTNGVFENIPFTPTGTPTPFNLFKAKVDGTLIDYSNDVIGGTVEANGNEYITINTVGDYKINIQTNSNITPGTYVFKSITDGGPVANLETADGTNYNITGGSLIITSNGGGVLKGTFNFEAKNGEGVTVHTVTEGTFEIGY